MDHDGRVSVEDYTKAVAGDKLLIEALGPCLPNTQVCRQILMYIYTKASTVEPRRNTCKLPYLLYLFGHCVLGTCSDLANPTQICII